MAKIKDEFKKLKGASSHDTSVLDIENEIEDLEAKIDATVFKLYGINTGQMNSIMTSLSLPEAYQIKVNNYYTESN